MKTHYLIIDTSTLYGETVLHNKLEEGWKISAIICHKYHLYKEFK